MSRSIVAERGVGLYEAAFWLVGIVPVALVGVSIFVVIHDRYHISGVPHAVLRESSATGLRWVPDGAGGRFEVDVERLRALIAWVAQRALVESRQGVLKADSVSAKACFWIFSVNSSTGRLESPIWSECDTRGPLGDTLSMASDLERERGKARGILVGDGHGFVDKVVVIGVVVAAEARRLLDSRVTYQFSKSSIAFAREEVVL